MNTGLFLLNEVGALLFAFGILVSRVQAACRQDETSFMCQDTEICYGGSTGITADDVLQCILTNGCDSSFRLDACDVCVQDGTKDASDFRDCNGDCWSPAEVDRMAVEDECGVCGGDGTTCDPRVTASDVKVAPSSTPLAFSISGQGLGKASNEIVVITRSVQGGRTLVSFVANATRGEANPDGTRLSISLEPLAAGIYEINVRKGPDGTEYEDVEGAKIYVYNPRDYHVQMVTPSDATLDGSVNGDFTLTLHQGWSDTTTSDLKSQEGAIYCYIADSIVVAADAATYVEEGETVVSASGIANIACTFTYPSASRAKYACVSFDKLVLIGCKKVTFYARAPSVVDNVATFTSAEQLTVTFDRAVTRRSVETCSLYFSQTLPFGAAPVCRLDSADQTKLRIKLGDGSTVGPGDMLEMRSGLLADGEEFSRVTVMTSLTVQASHMPPIEIAVNDLWPDKITNAADAALTLRINLVYLPGDRPPANITWTVNDEQQVAYDDSLTMAFDVSGNEPNYAIKVEVTDFFGGSAVIDHVITKVDVNVPTAILYPAGVQYLPSGEIQIYPRSFHGIGTRIQYVDTGDNPLAAFHFQWRLNDTEVAGLYSHNAAPDEITIQMCGETVIYSLTIGSLENIGVFEKYSVSLNVVCRNPVARILGNNEVAVSVSNTAQTKIRGEASYDPDGGTDLQYQWTCLVNGEDCMPMLRLTGQATFPTLDLSPSRMTPATWYTFTLRVTVEKNDGNYTATTSVRYRAEAVDTPETRTVTMRDYFRHDVRVMIKIYVGKDPNVVVRWGFVKHPDLEWLDVNDPSVGTRSQVTEDSFAWYTIEPNQLIPGRAYKLQVNVTRVETGGVARLEKTIIVHEALRACTVLADPLVEFTETGLTLQNCLYDPMVEWLDLVCYLEGKLVSTDRGMQFTVPYFDDRTITQAQFKCLVRDSLGQEMTVASNTVGVTLSGTARKVAEKALVDNFESLERPVDALEVLCGGEIQDKAMQRIPELIKAGLTDSETRRVVKSMVQLRSSLLTRQELRNLIHWTKTLLEKLCSASRTSTIFISNDELKAVIEFARNLTLGDRPRMTMYRDIEDLVVCIKLKHMKNEDYDIIEVRHEEAGNHVYLVNALDDVRSFDVGVQFPEDLRERYRDQWDCTSTAVCHGVGIKVEQYTSEPPDIQNGRTDTECAKYTFVDLYNQANGKSIPINYVKGKVDIEMSMGECSRPKCWYYNEVLKIFADDGVTSEVRNGTVICQTNHLTGFSIRSEPPLYDGHNYPHTILLVLGIPLILLTAVILVKVFLFILDGAAARDTYVTKETEPRDDDKKRDHDGIDNDAYTMKDMASNDYANEKRDSMFEEKI